MSIAALATNGRSPAAPDHAPYRFSVKQYDQMVEHGILGPNDRVELIEGWIVRKMWHNLPHARSIVRLTKLLARLLPDEWELHVQLPIALARSRLEPDFAIVRGPDERYAERLPRPADIDLLIEVADASVLSDRRSKIPLYAAAKIREVWLVNLVQGQVEVSSLPRSGKSPGYRERQDSLKGDNVPLVLEGKEFASLSVSRLCLLKD